MKNAWKMLVLCAAATAALSAAARVVARVTDAESVRIRGVSVPMEGLSSWPVALNDEIATGNAPAKIRFPDGSTISLGRESRVRIEPAGRSYAVRVVSGSVFYDINPASTLRVIDARGAARAGASQPVGNGAWSANRSGVVLGDVPMSNARVLAAEGNRSVILLANGTRMFVTTGDDNVARIEKIEYPVSLPDGTTKFVPVQSSQLIGATVTIDVSKPDSQPITITPAGSSTPLSPADAQQELTTSATAAVEAAIGSGALPPGSTPAPAAPVDTATVSAPAP